MEADVVVVTDDTSLYDALYVDGVLVQQAETIYASDIAHALNGRAMKLRTENIEIGEGGGFMQSLEETLKLWSV